MRTSRFSLRSSRRGFTLIEVLIATLITLILVGGMAIMFGQFSEGVSDSRAVTAMQDNLRHAKNILSRDLRGTTALTTPPLDPAAQLGYFELIEGPIGPVFYPVTKAMGNGITAAQNNSYTFPLNDVNLSANLQSAVSVGQAIDDDSTLGDVDDVLMFTARSLDQAYTGTGFPSSSLNSSHAEIIWFLRGNTLYRRVLLISNIGPALYTYSNTPISVSVQNFRTPSAVYADASATERRFYTSGNSLGDLTKRENRFCHQPLAFPHDSRFFMRAFPVVNQTSIIARPTFIMPTVAETSSGYGASDGFPWPAEWARVTSSTVKAKVAYVAGAGGVPGNDMQVVTPTISTSATYFTQINGQPGNALGNQMYLYARPDTTTAARRVFDPWSRRPLELNTNDFSISPYTSSAITASMTKDTGAGNFTSAPPAEYMYGYGYSNRLDDVLMTNVLSFDVKVWDPGAPLFVLPDPSLSTMSMKNGIQATILPDDPAYKSMLSGFITSGTPIPVSYGAYVDLNYMWGASKYSRLHNPAFVPGGSTTPDAYLDRLDTYETSMGMPRYTLPRPAFAGPGQSVSRSYDKCHWLNYSSFPNPATMPPSSAPDLVGALHENWNADPTVAVAGLNKSGLASIYDTFSTHYEQNGLDDDRNGIVDDYTNGLDDPGSDPGIDDPSERETVPPYPAPLRGIQIRIRVFEPDSRQIREVTVTHEFLPES